MGDSQAEFDEMAERMSAIMGAGLDLQVINSQYHVDRGQKSSDDLGHRLLLRAQELRTEESARE